MDMTLFRQYTSMAEASIAQGRLRSDGIDCRLQQSTMNSLLGGGMVDGGVQLYVKADQLEEAARALDNQ